MKKRNLGSVVLIVSALLVLAIILMAYANKYRNKQTQTNQPKTNYERPTYLVTKSTGLYKEPNADSDYIAELSVGTELQPAYGTMDCVTFTDTYDPTTEFTLCRMKVVSTGEMGWVLQKWISED